MSRALELQQYHNNVKQSIVTQQIVRTNEYSKGDYGYCLICMLIGILLGSIPFVTILTLYLSPTKSESTTSKPTPTLRWNRTGITIAGITGRTSASNNTLNIPWGLYIDSSNTLFITDTGNHRVQKYFKDALFGETVAGRASGNGGNKTNELRNPRDVFVDLSDNIYISDSENHRIQLWARGASNGTTIAGITGMNGSSSDQLRVPRGVIFDPIKNGIYISDHDNHRIMFYPNGIINGTVIAGGNGYGFSSNQLSYPVGLHLDVISNSLIIANSGANNIVQWTLGASNWTLIAGHLNGLRGNTSDRFWNPHDVVLDPMGNMYVVEYQNHRVQFFPVGEKNGITIAGVTNSAGATDLLLNGSRSIVLDNQLNLYVADRNNHRIQKFLRY